MKDFGRWLTDFTLPAEKVKTEEEEFPEGVSREANGDYYAECCCCGNYTALQCDISEVPMTGYQHYCGGSPHCCP